MVFRRICGVVLLLVYGFVVFLTLAGLGFSLALVLAVVPWWKILIGWFLGTLMVVLHVIGEIAKEEKNNA